LTVATDRIIVLPVSITNTSGRRREAFRSIAVWLGLLGVLILVVPGIGLLKRGLPLLGWPGDTSDDLYGWTVLTLPIVFLAWLPVALLAIGTTARARLSRHAWVVLSIVLYFGLLAVLGASI
jgi:hypothetical protein